MACLDKLNECSRSRNARIFVVCLIVVLCLVGVFMHLSEGQTSSLELLPNFNNDNLIRFVASNEKSYDPIVEQISESLKPYKSNSPNIYRGCDFLNPAPNGKTCGVNLEEFGFCSEENEFGYYKSSPCVFLKLKQKANWIPEYYNGTDLPETMPWDLKSLIQGVNANKHSKEWQMIWVSCEGNNPYDFENIGPISYLPRRGFPGYFYPCTSEEGCTAPIIAINFEKPKTGVLISVGCKLWAKNLEETIDFHLLID